MRLAWRECVLGVALFASTLAVCWPVLDANFINLDDNYYVTENPLLRDGLNGRSVGAAFTRTQAGYWIPLTWISYQLDYQLYGLRPWGYHLTNLLLHAVNSLLLLGVLRCLTGAVWQSAAVAALFALHPLQVESVAWVTERKDVLSTCFGFLALLAYARYVQRPGVARYLALVLLFAASLLAKPMLVTLPVLLLLLDYWPLGRFDTNPKRQRGRPETPRWRFGLVWEKLPLFALAAAAGATTVLTQQAAGLVKSLHSFPLHVRLANAVVAYVSYLGKLLWPSDLAIWYPHPRAGWPAWQVILAALILAAISMAAAWTARRRPYFVVGWLWYLVALLPVIGLVQVASQAMADRFTYVPLVGLFLAVVWGVADLVKGWRDRRLILGMAAGLVLFVCALLTWLQVHYWRNSLILWQHTLEVTRDNYFAHNQLGGALLGQGKAEEAAEQFAASLRLRPPETDPLWYAHFGLGDARWQQGRIAEASQEYAAALRIGGSDASLQTRLAEALFLLTWRINTPAMD